MQSYQLTTEDFKDDLLMTWMVDGRSSCEGVEVLGFLSDFYLSGKSLYNPTWFRYTPGDVDVEVRILVTGTQFGPVIVRVYRQEWLRCLMFNKHWVIIYDQHSERFYPCYSSSVSPDETDAMQGDAIWQPFIRDNYLQDPTRQLSANIAVVVSQSSVTAVFADRGYQSSDALFPYFRARIWRPLHALYLQHLDHLAHRAHVKHTEWKDGCFDNRALGITQQLSQVALECGTTERVFEGDGLQVCVYPVVNEPGLVFPRYTHEQKVTYTLRPTDNGGAIIYLDNENTPECTGDALLSYASMLPIFGRNADGSMVGCPGGMRVFDDETPVFHASSDDEIVHHRKRGKLSNEPGPIERQRLQSKERSRKYRQKRKAKDMNGIQESEQVMMD